VYGAPAGGDSAFGPAGLAKSGIPEWLCTVESLLPKSGDSDHRPLPAPAWDYGKRSCGGPQRGRRGFYPDTGIPGRPGADEGIDPESACPAPFTGGKSRIQKPSDGEM